MQIHIKGASEHNLKGIDVDIVDGLTVVTGVSGSGKTSLVFDTLYHEARRRLLDVISVGRPGGWQHQLLPAQVESITGLGPALAVEQNILNRNPLSTLASASGLHPFLRLLYAHFSVRHCQRCGEALNIYSQDEIIALLLAASQQEPLRVFAPLLHGVKGSHRTLLHTLAGQFDRSAIWLDGRPWGTEPLDPRQPHILEVALGGLDRTANAAQARHMAAQAAAMGAQAIVIRDSHQTRTLASAPVCAGCGAWFGELEPKHFHLPCPYCKGHGCAQCDGTAMHPLAAGAHWAGKRLPELLACTVNEILAIFNKTETSGMAQRLHAEITRRLRALERVGLGYLSLDRSSPTLSRGESQRVRLAISLTSPLEDMLHVLDEPTIGQHPADVARFLPAFRELPGPVVYVEHDRVAAAVADRVIDLGPEAGVQGGELVFQGSPAELWNAPTHTGRYFSLRETVNLPARRDPPEQFLSLRGAYLHNLKDIDVAIPLGRLTVITGVSGSGKSTLVEHVLVPSLEQRKPVGCLAIQGAPIKTMLVDQSPIGHNPRSNPATYIKLADIVRELYAQVTGLSASQFSFNRPEGACPTCNGLGAIEIKMKFTYPIWVRCSDCEGQRFNEETLAATADFGGANLSIAAFYRLPVAEIITLFQQETRLPLEKVKAARRILRALSDVGLGYLPLGQPSPSLSGGEAQRVKLTKYLGRAQLDDRLLALDEPSTGLHPKDLDGLLALLDRLVRSGATIVVVEHNTDLIRAADWVIDLGPGAGPEGGRIVYAGPPEGLHEAPASLTGNALALESQIQPRARSGEPAMTGSEAIRIRKARANNLQDVDVDIPKGKLTVVTGVSGSGKSSLVRDILEAEALRRYLESLSMYERQGAREGPQAPVDSISGLGLALTIRSESIHAWSALSHFTRRASVGRASELSVLLAVLLSHLGERNCPGCGSAMQRLSEFTCPACGLSAPIPQARHFSTQNYASACAECTGVGVLFKPQPERLIIHPEKPLCGGAMHSPGYWPQTYLCQDTGIAQALGAHYGFDPERTSWNEMSEPARQAFLFGDDNEYEFTYRSKSSGKLATRSGRWEGFYGGWVRDWDVHGTYTQQVPCPQCDGAGLKAEYLAVTLAGHNFHELSQMSLERLSVLLEELTSLPTEPREQAGMLRSAWSTAHGRLRFLQKVGLGYLHLNRPIGTLSAGEAQRIQLAGLLGSELTGLTVLLDEPSRGMHPCELEALIEVLVELRDQGNTLVVVEHDLQLIQAADYVIDLGPGAGALGGRLIACGAPAEIAHKDTPTGQWLRAAGTRHAPQPASLPGSLVQVDLGSPRLPGDWLVVTGARENNLRGDPLEIPLRMLTAVCGVSGSGKSTLVIDTLGRALVPKTHTTSFAHEPMQPGAYESIEGPPVRAILVDQAHKGIQSPAAFLGLTRPLLKCYAESPDALALGLDENDLGRRCSACRGRGTQRIDMGFLPDLFVECETCQGTGCIPEAWEVRLRGCALPQINALTLDEVYARFQDEPNIARPLELARQVGLGYLVWRQPAYTLSGGETQRLKIAKELCRAVPQETLFILDEPTVGQHMQDVMRLIQVLRQLVEAGNSVVLVEHHLHVLAACDWLIELGPGGGAQGGRVIAAGPPAQLAMGNTPTAPYLRALLEAGNSLESIQ